MEQEEFEFTVIVTVKPGEPAEDTEACSTCGAPRNERGDSAPEPAERWQIAEAIRDALDLVDLDLLYVGYYGEWEYEVASLSADRTERQRASEADSATWSPPASG
jgi:hypothetical protein